MNPLSTVVWHTLNGTLLTDLYACSSEPCGWAHVLDNICQLTGARAATIQLLCVDGMQARSQFILCDSLSETLSALYEPHLSDQVNPRVRCSHGPWIHTRQLIVRDHDLFDPGSEPLEEIRKRTAAVGLGNFLAAGLPISNRQFVVLSLHRPLDDSHDFAEEHKALLTGFMPHLRQAVGLAEKFHALRRHSADLEAATNKLRCGMIICDAGARVIWRNHATEMLLSERTHLRISAGELTTASPQETRKLRQAIASLAQLGSADVGPDPATAVPVVLHGRPGTDAPLHVMVLPLERPSADVTAIAQESGGAGRVLLLVSSLSVSKILRADVVARLFSLTPTEANLVVELCLGRTVTEYAASHRVSVGTARFQLKRILSKTQTARQSDLVRAVCCSIASQISDCPVPAPRSRDALPINASNCAYS